MMDAYQARGEEIRLSGRPMAEVLDELILEDGAHVLPVIVIIRVAYGLGLKEAKALVEGRCHELKAAPAIAASRAWIDLRVAELKAGDRSFESAVIWLAQVPSSGHGVWAWGGPESMERAVVLAEAFALPFSVAFDRMRALERVSS